MKRNLKIFIGIVLFFTILVTSTVVKASTFDCAITASKTTIAPGETTLITLKVTNINMGTNGVKTLSGYLDYDEKYFEEVTAINGVGTSPWTWGYNSTTKVFTGMLLSNGV